MKSLIKTTFFIAFILFAAHASADMIIGGDVVHTVGKGENLYRIGAKYGVYWKTIARANGLNEKDPLIEGTTLKLNTRRIVPRVVDNGIIVNIPDRTLYFFRDKQLMALPVGLGAIYKNEYSDWKTPEGKFRIVSKRKNPTWYVPESIQIEYAIKGKNIEESVPPGPKNPLGKYAIRTSLPAVLIHETILPASVYRYMSHGCIRMLPEHIEQLFPLVEVNMQGEIIYEPVKIARVEDGRTFVEIRTDIYRRHRSLRDYTAKLIEARGVSDKVDWQKIGRLLKEESGIAQDVSLGEPAKSAASSGNGSLRPGFTDRVVDYFKSKFNKADQVSTQQF
ncbi:MAG: ErfK/YbiS/YcfS/YnhG family protein [Deltaproteobacteria bacterium]|nr:ErfK/YbiS/YcfS/YnhG family protein [Deltaproteobacteria bacterium]